MASGKPVKPEKLKGEKGYRRNSNLNHTYNTALPKANLQRPKKHEERSLQITNIELSKYNAHSIHLYNMIPIDNKDPDQCIKRIGEYFECCEKDQVKPSVPGLALALYMDTSTLWERANRGKNQVMSEVIKRAYQTLETEWVNFGVDGKINPAAWIFIMKNSFGYKDQTELRVSKVEEETEDLQGLAEKYKGSIVTDYEDKTV